MSEENGKAIAALEDRLDASFRSLISAMKHWREMRNLRAHQYPYSLDEFIRREKEHIPQSRPGRWFARAPIVRKHNPELRRDFRAGSRTVHRLSGSKAVVILSAPGLRLNAIAAFVCSKQLHERVFQQVIAEMQHEYFEALKDGHERKAQWVMWRGRLSFVLAALAQVPVSATQLIVKLWKAAI